MSGDHEDAGTECIFNYVVFFYKKRKGWENYCNKAGRKINFFSSRASLDAVSAGGEKFKLEKVTPLLILTFLGGLGIVLLYAFYFPKDYQTRSQNYKHLKVTGS